MKVIEGLWENDKLGLKTAINHVAVSGSSWSSNTTTALITAIDQGNPILVLKLLEAGAKPDIDFESWLQGAKFSFESELGVSSSYAIPTAVNTCTDFSSPDSSIIIFPLRDKILVIFSSLLTD